MKKKMWTGTVLRHLFEWLPKIKVNEKTVGYYNRNWSSKPSHMTMKEWDRVLDILLQKMLDANLFDDKTPKSKEAVSMQIQHCIAPQNHPGYRKMRSSIRMMAYYSGFIEMCDIVYLEERAKEKHGERS